MFEPFKNYFVNHPKCPTVVLNFFLKEFSKCWLHFIRNQLEIFNQNIQRMERQIKLQLLKLLANCNY
jgi:hypothetical protein